jgi:hypothetical protein
VVAGRRFVAVGLLPLGEELRADVLHRGPRRDERGGDVERGR